LSTAIKACGLRQTSGTDGGYYLSPFWTPLRYTIQLANISETLSVALTQPHIRSHLSIIVTYTDQGEKPAPLSIFKITERNARLGLVISLPADSILSGRPSAFEYGGPSTRLAEKAVQFTCSTECCPLGHHIFPDDEWRWLYAR